MPGRIYAEKNIKKKNVTNYEERKIYKKQPTTPNDTYAPLFSLKNIR